eukprot:533772-Pelagomonas_calceolata.AAC.8
MAPAAAMCFLSQSRINIFIKLCTSQDQESLLASLSSSSWCSNKGTCVSLLQKAAIGVYTTDAHGYSETSHLCTFFHGSIVGEFPLPAKWLFLSSNASMHQADAPSKKPHSSYFEQQPAPKDATGDGHHLDHKESDAI